MNVSLIEVFLWPSACSVNDWWSRGGGGMRRVMFPSPSLRLVAHCHEMLCNIAVMIRSDVCR
jgi:hypothetical protein